MTTDSDMQMDVMFEGTQRGTPRMRALFGPGCSGSESPVSDVTEAQAGWPTEDDFPEGARSPGVGLADVVARLQKEVEEFWLESRYDYPGMTSVPPQHSGWTGFTSTSVPMLAGTTSWDQYRQGTVTVGVSVLTDAGSELPADFAGATTVRVAPLAEAGEVTLDAVGLDVPELLYRTDSDDDLPPTVADPIAVNGFARPDAVPVVMVNLPTGVIGDDRILSQMALSACWSVGSTVY